MIKWKLDTDLVPTSPKKTAELKFTDYSINKFEEAMGECLGSID